MYTLRDYQQEAVDRTWDYIHNKPGNPLIAISTGGGKSIIIADLTRRTLKEYPTMRIAMVTHQKELIQQNAEKLRTLMPGINLGVYSASLNKRDKSNRVMYMGIQSVHKKASVLGPFNIVFIDEAHLVNNNIDKSETMYARFLKDLKAMNPKMRVIGLTATPFRTGQGLLTHGDLFDSVVYKTEIKHLQEQGYLAPLTTVDDLDAIDTSNIGTRAGDFIKKQLAEAAEFHNTEGAVSDIVKYGAKRKSWVVFCVSVEHAERVVKLLRDRAVNTALITGKTRSADREDILSKFKLGMIKCVVNVNVLTTGFDHPGTDMIAVLRPTMSPGLWCLDADTEILTREGFKKCDDITRDDYISSPETETLRSTWEKPVALLKKPVAERTFVTYESKMLSIKVTENHEMVFTGRKSKEGWRKERAGVLAERKDGFLLPTATTMDFPGVPLTDSELTFLGLVATDGTIDKSNNAIRIYQSTSKKQVSVCEMIEKSLKGCGFKYHKKTRPASSNFGDGYADINIWQISKGKPRGIGKQLRGWGALESYVHKTTIPRELMEGMTKRQFEVYLAAVDAGDGFKQPKNVTWKKNNIHIGQKSKTYIEQLQFMCVTRGLSANISVDQRENGPFYFIHVKKGPHRTVGGSNQLDRPRMEKSISNEMVWCVQTPSGNIVTRRKGKVCVMGNCQMIGRGLRIAEGKTDCLVLDFGENISRHGPLDEMDIPTPMKRKGQAVMKTCPECYAEVPGGVRLCSFCSHEFPPPQLNKDCATAYAKGGQIIHSTLGKGIRQYVVTRVVYCKHTTRGGDDVLRVIYRGPDDKEIASEYLTIECEPNQHWKRQKAMDWWFKRDGKKVFPKSINDAISRHAELAEPKSIICTRKGSYWNVTEAVF